MMLILTVPVEILYQLQRFDQDDLCHRFLELLAAEGYKKDILTLRQLMLLLEFTQREELWEFLQKNNIRWNRAIEDL